MPKLCSKVVSEASKLSDLMKDHDTGGTQLELKEPFAKTRTVIHVSAWLSTPDLWRHEPRRMDSRIKLKLDNRPALKAQCLLNPKWEVRRMMDPDGNPLLSGTHLTSKKPTLEAYNITTHTTLANPRIQPLYNPPKAHESRKEP